MTKIRTVSFLLLVFLCHVSFGKGKEIIIPFQLTEFNNIVFRAVLNESDTVDLMFHTAANSVTLTEDVSSKIKSVVFNSNAEDVKSWGGENNSSRLSEHNSIQIGELKFNEISIWEDKYSGPHTDGKFGIDLFKDYFINIDFEKSKLILSSTLPDDIKKYEKLKLILKNDMMFLEASFRIQKTTYKNTFLIHSGYSGGILFDDKFASENKIESSLKIIGEKKLLDSYGNTLKTMKAILPNMKIGSMELSNLSVGFFSGALGRQKICVLGGDILRRFDIVIDLKREFIYLRLNRFKNEPYKES